MSLLSDKREGAVFGKVVSSDNIEKFVYNNASIPFKFQNENEVF